MAFPTVFLLHDCRGAFGGCSCPPAHPTVGSDRASHVGSCDSLALGPHCSSCYPVVPGVWEGRPNTCRACPAPGAHRLLARCWCLRSGGSGHMEAVIWASRSGADMGSTCGHGNDPTRHCCVAHRVCFLLRGLLAASSNAVPSVPGCGHGVAPLGRCIVERAKASPERCGKGAIKGASH